LVRWFLGISLLAQVLAQAFRGTPILLGEVLGKGVGQIVTGAG